MNTFKISLDCAPEGAYLDAYIPSILPNKKRRALLIIPGGGYSSLAEEREGSPIAEAFIPYGFTPFVLHYYVGKKKPFPIQLIQSSYAIKHIKEHAEEYGIAPDEVFAVGFSAGGHLAGSLAVMNSYAELYQGTGIDPESIKLRGAMLIYPVITPKYHIASFKNLLCTAEPGESELELVSLDKQVTENCAPVFIMHTSNDGAVNVMNSLALAEAYSSVGTEYEMHIYPDAPHGIALANDITSENVEKWNNKRIAEWVRMSSEWADELIKKQKKDKV